MNVIVGLVFLVALGKFGFGFIWVLLFNYFLSIWAGKYCADRIYDLDARLRDMVFAKTGKLPHAEPHAFCDFVLATNKKLGWILPGVPIVAILVALYCEYELVKLGNIKRREQDQTVFKPMLVTGFTAPGRFVLR